MDDQRCSLADSEPTPDPAARGNNSNTYQPQPATPLLTCLSPDVSIRARNGGQAGAQGKQPNGVQHQVIMSFGEIMFISSKGKQQKKQVFYGHAMPLPPPAGWAKFPTFATKNS